MCAIYIVICSFFYLWFRIKKNIHMLQQNFYNENNRYLKWGIKKLFNMFNFVDIIAMLINLINLFLKNEYLILFNFIYIILYFIERERNKKIYSKLPLKITSRVKRIFFTNVLIYVFLFVFYLIFDNIYLFNFIYSFFVSFVFFVVYLSNILNIPVEKIVFLSYRCKALKKLRDMSNLEVIGITGSYGKTSCKNVLNEILSVRFNPLASPQNYNTQYGLIITINNYINKFNDFFIAEMGAFKVGRIKLLCNLVKPKYGIITSIGTAHLETFGSRENIQKGKFELIESLPSDGIAILNKDDPYQVDYNIKNKCNIIWIAIDNKDADVIAKDIKIDANGMKFSVYFKKGNINYNFNTKLLGRANIYNILCAVAFAYYKGMTLEEIEKGIRKIKAVPHRLELKKTSKYIIIDDAYNSNPIGSKMALEVLNLMEGTKFVVTPGMIELGEEQYNLNKKFGEYISEVADYVILVGKEQTKPIVEGLKLKKYDKNNIFVINDVRDAFKIIDGINSNSTKYILLENDLPDIFNEK